MAYDQGLAERVREMLQSQQKVEEKKMFNGLAFMVNEKMCICVSNNNLMCRVDPLLHTKLDNKKGWKLMEMKGKLLEGYILVNQEFLKDDQELKF